MKTGYLVLMIGIISMQGCLGKDTDPSCSRNILAGCITPPPTPAPLVACLEYAAAGIKVITNTHQAITTITAKDTESDYEEELTWIETDDGEYWFGLYEKPGTFEVKISVAGAGTCGAPLEDTKEVTIEMDEDDCNVVPVEIQFDISDDMPPPEEGCP